MKAVVKDTLLGSGHYHRQLRSFGLPGLAILCYHNVLAEPDIRAPFRPLHVAADRLRAHVRFLAKSCTPVGLADVIACYTRGQPLPDRAALVTFDDGYRSMLTLAAPILAEFNVPATFFVCTGPAERGELHWYDALALARGDGFVQAVKALPGSARAAALAEVSRDPQQCPAAQPLSVQEIAALAARPGCTVAAHTAEHPILARETARRQREEIAGSIAKLTAWTGKPITALAYPNGHPGEDFDAVAMAIAESAGVQVAFSTHEAYAGPLEHPLTLPRFVMTDFGAGELAHRLSYSWSRNMPAAAPRERLAA